MTIKYLYGYVVGSIVAGYECLAEGKMIEYDNYHEREVVLFKTRKLAIKYAYKHGYEYTRAYTYETDNPDHAKGLTKLKDATDTKTIYLTPK